MLSQPNGWFTLSVAIFSSCLTFLGGALLLVVSQAYQRWLDRRLVASALLTEALDILDALQVYQEILDKLGADEELPTIAITKDDMQVYFSNTSKISLLIPTGMMYIVKFYSRVRRIAAGAPVRDYMGVGIRSASEGKESLAKMIADAISIGHAVVNHLKREVPPERLSARSGASLDISTFKERENKRHGWTSGVS